MCAEFTSLADDKSKIDQKLRRMKMYKTLGAALTVFAAIFFTFATNVNAQPGLVGYWPAEGNASDVIGGHNGTLINTAGFAPGFAGQAFSLGISGYVEVPDSPSLSMTGPFTLEANIYLNTNVQQAIIEKYDYPGLNGYGLRLLSGKITAFICDPTLFGATHGIIGATTVSPGVWHHVAAVYDGATLAVYLDGVLDGTVATPVTPTDGAASLKIGARGDDANTRLNGMIDEVKIYNRALSQSEVQFHANLVPTPPTPTTIPTPGPAPASSLAYVAHQGKSVEIVNLATNMLVGSISLGFVPNEIALSPDGRRAYVSLWSNSLAVIDTSTRSVVGNIYSGGGPFGVAVKPDGSKVFVTNSNSNNVSVINTATNAVVATVPVGIYPRGVALSPGGERAYITNYGSDTISIIDTATNSVTTTFSLATIGPFGDAAPWTISISPDGSRAVVANLYDACVTVVDLNTNTVVRKIGIGGLPASPLSVVISPDGLFAYAAVENTRNVVVIDLTSLIVAAFIPEGTSPWGIALSANGSRAYVANYNNGFTVIDTSTRSVIANVPMAQGPVHIALWEVPSDSTPPVITPTVTGPLGNNGWYLGNVNIAWSVIDRESTVSSSTGCDASNVTADTSGVTFTCSATSLGGTATQSVTIKRDATEPTITSSASANGNPYTAGSWTNQNVIVTFVCSDTGSGLGSVTSPVTKSGEGASQAANGTCTDIAGNISSSSFTGINIDKTAPVISVTSPSAGATYLLNQSVSASYGCTDALSGVATCSGATANGVPINTSSVGAKTFVVNSTDNAGNAAVQTTVNYNVAYGLVALYDQTRAHRSGSTVPIKVRLVDATGANISSPSIVVHAVSVVQTSSQASTEFGDAGNSNPDFDFRYDAALGGYIFNLQTTGFGTGSYLLNFVAGGGPTVYSVGFQVRQ